MMGWIWMDQVQQGAATRSRHEVSRVVAPFFHGSLEGINISPLVSKSTFN